MIGLDPCQIGWTAEVVNLHLARLDQRGKVRGMGITGRRLLAAAGKLLQPELADRFQDTESRLVPLHFDAVNQMLVHERRQEIEDGGGRERSEATPLVPPGAKRPPYALCCFQGEAPGEYRQPAELCLLGGREQVVGPGNRVA